MKISFSVNINEKVKIRLTEYGFKILKEYYKNHKELIPYQDEHEMQIHEIMNIFGSEMYNGNPNQCFVDNEIVFGVK